MKVIKTFEIANLMVIFVDEDITDKSFQSKVKIGDNLFKNVDLALMNTPEKQYNCFSVPLNEAISKNITGLAVEFI